QLGLRLLLLVLHGSRGGSVSSLLREANTRSVKCVPPADAAQSPRCWVREPPADAA
ncbi:hypothetical protein ABZP36_033529, partial [Zizania latifolia]